MCDVYVQKKGLRLPCSFFLHLVISLTKCIVIVSGENTGVVCVCVCVCVCLCVCLSRAVWRNYWADFDETFQK